MQQRFHNLQFSEYCRVNKHYVKFKNLHCLLSYNSSLQQVMVILPYRKILKSLRHFDSTSPEVGIIFKVGIGKAFTLLKNYVLHVQTFFPFL